MSTYPIPWKSLTKDPLGIDPDLTLNMSKASTPATPAAAVCKPCCSRYEYGTFSGVLFSGVGFITLQDAGSFSLVITAVCSTCGSSNLTWNLDVLDDANLTLTLDSQDTDPDGNPRAFISGTTTGGSPLAGRISLSLDGEPFCLPISVGIEALQACDLSFDTIGDFAGTYPNFTYPGDVGGSGGSIIISPLGPHPELCPCLTVNDTGFCYFTSGAFNLIDNLDGTWALNWDGSPTGSCSFEIALGTRTTAYGSCDGDPMPAPFNLPLFINSP